MKAEQYPPATRPRRSGTTIPIRTTRPEPVVGAGGCLGPRALEGDGDRLEVHVAGWSRRGAATAADGRDQDLPLLRGGDQGGGAQVQALRDLAGPPARAVRCPLHHRDGLRGPRARRRVRPGPAADPLPRRRDGLRRPGGLARYFAFDPTWLRIVYALGTFFTALIPGIIVYGILALIIPGDVPEKGPGVE